MIISEMQSKLATWAEADDQRKFDRLLRLIANRSWLLEAARITLASSGARTAGIDGINKAMLEGHLDQHWSGFGYNCCLEITGLHQQGEFIFQKQMVNKDH